LPNLYFRESRDSKYLQRLFFGFAIRAASIVSQYFAHDRRDTERRQYFVASAPRNFS
jgi:hypothetical protein